MSVLRRFAVVVGAYGLVGFVMALGCVQTTAGPAAKGSGAADRGSSERASSDAPLGAQGGPCRTTRASSPGDRPCDRLLRCDESSRRCVIDETAGTAYGPCYPNDTCNGDLLCDVAIDTCGPRPALGTDGGPCYGNGTCDGYLTCVAGRCAVSATKGDE